MTIARIKNLTPVTDPGQTIMDPVLAFEAAPLIRRNINSARRDVREQNMLIDTRDWLNPVGIPARKFGRDWTVNRADLAAFERLVFLDTAAPADAGLSRELGLFVYTGEARYTAVGNVWPLITLSASEPGVCSVYPVEGVAHRAVVDVFDEARFREALKAVFA